MKNTFTTTGLSMNELLVKYGKGSKGFFSDWFKNETWAKEKPSAGTWKIYEDKNLFNKTYAEQKALLKKGFDFPHPAVLAEIILTHYKKTGERLLENWYSRTNTLNAGGDRLNLGRFGESGLRCDDNWNWIDDRLGALGVFPLGVKKLGRSGVEDKIKSIDSKLEEIDFLTDEVKNLKDKIRRIKEIIKE